MPTIDFRERLLECLGGPWPEPCDLKVEVARVEQADGFRREFLSYEVEPDDRVPAILLVPDAATAARPVAGICVWHQHNGAYSIGKVEPAGLAGSEMHHTGVALARLGYVVLCPDALGFGERNVVRMRPGGGHIRDGALERFEFLRYVVTGKSLAWKNILDMRRAVDFLCTRPEVQADKLGCYGHSMGSTHTWLIGPWEERLVALCGNCCLPTYAAIDRTEILHCFPNFIPGLYQYGDTPDIAALIAPRALHFNLGALDGGSPIDEARAGLEHIARAYESMHAEDKFSYFVEEDADHVLSPAMWERVQAFFKTHLA